MPSKRLLVIAGPNGSGKSSLVTSAKLAIAEDKIINPDNYARGMTDIDDEVKRYQIAMEACRSLREELLKEGISFGFETVASTQEKLDFVKKAKQRGYEILLLFVTAGSPEKCCERIRQRVAAGGHDVPREKVFSRYARTLTYLPEYIELADRAEVFDNSDALVRVCSKTDGKVTITPEGSSLEWVRRYLSRYV